jgi:Uncharacterized protein conserved in bacteria
MLLDFYGELLTDKQRECFDLHYNEDLSLSEIAEQLGISRQGVWDNIRRAEAAMKEIEEKTGLIRRFENTKRALEAIARRAEEIGDLTEGRAKELARQIAEEIERLEE